MKISFGKVALIAALALMGTSVSEASAGVGGLARNLTAKRPGLFMVAKSEALAPFAFVKFCQGASDQCSRRGGDNIIELTGAKRALLQRINFQVNMEVSYVADTPDDDDWKIGKGSGDCEDIALTKRKRLLAAGLPSGALRIATAFTAEGIGHAVLVVTTSKGDLVLDNRTNIVKPWFATGLRWGKIQSPQDPQRWMRL